MSYVEKNLISGETLVFQTGVHWIVLVPQTLFAILIAAVGIGAYVYRPSLMIVAIIFLPIGVFILIYAIMQRNSTEMAVTNRRVIIKTGMMSRRSLEIMLQKVESIGIEESAFGRMFGYGTVTIHGTGGTPEPFRMIAHPSEFRKEVQQQMDAASR
jgi:uncharacterized membrane protein YdbT with pleckstrin-like domain